MLKYVKNLDRRKKPNYTYLKNLVKTALPEKEASAEARLSEKTEVFEGFTLAPRLNPKHKKSAPVVNQRAFTSISPNESISTISIFSK
jgi:hypothetical protein